MSKKKKLNGTVPATLTCVDCEKKKKSSEFGHLAVGKYQKRTRCKVCWAIYVNLYRHTDRGRIATKIVIKRYLDKQQELNK